MVFQTKTPQAKKKSIELPPRSEAVGPTTVGIECPGDWGGRGASAVMAALGRDLIVSRDKLEEALACDKAIHVIDNRLLIQYCAV